MYATDRGGVALGEDFAFAKGSAELNDAGRHSITQLAAKLNQGEFANARIVVEGHTDDTPVARHSTIDKYADNWGLSAARGAAVVRALQAAGVDPHRLYGAFRGEFDPHTAKGDATKSTADKAADRRVELYIK